MNTLRLAQRAALLACLSATLMTGVAQGEPAWTTYHRDPGRSGDDPEATQSGAPVLAWQTENLGRWCAKFTGVTSDSLDAVEDWYRRTLYRASETDLTRDERFRGYPTLSGIKLVLGVDYVALYRIPNQPTIIELHRCGGNR